jgi:hypothetical protein
MPAAAPSMGSGTMGIVTLAIWLLTMSIGAYMLRSVVRHGGLQRQRAIRGGLHPGVLVGHFSLAVTGFAVWVSFLGTGWDPLAWSAVVLLMPTIGLGICTVTLWTPYPRSPAAAAPEAGAPGPPASGPPAPGAPAPGAPARDAAGPAPAAGEPPGGLLPAPPAGAVRGRLTDAMLARAMTDEALAARLIDDVIASLPAEPPGHRRKARAYPVAVIPFGHGLAALATFALAVITAIGAR